MTQGIKPPEPNLEGLPPEQLGKANKALERQRETWLGNPLEKISDLLKNLIDSIKNLPRDNKFPAFIIISFIVLVIILTIAAKSLSGSERFGILVIFTMFLIFMLYRTKKPSESKASRQLQIPRSGEQPFPFQQRPKNEALKEFSKKYNDLCNTATRRNKIRLIIPIAKCLPDEYKGVKEIHLIAKLIKSDNKLSQVEVQNIVDQAVNLGFLRRRKDQIFLGDGWTHIQIRAICYLTQEKSRIESRGIWPDAPPTRENWWDPDWDEFLIHISHIAGDKITRMILVCLANPKEKGGQYVSSLRLMRRIIISDAPMDQKAVIALVEFMLEYIIELLTGKRI